VLFDAKTLADFETQVPKVSYFASKKLPPASVVAFVSFNSMVSFSRASIFFHVQMKLITTSTVSERFKVTGTLARVALLGLEKEGKIRAVTKHSSQVIFTRATKA